MSNMAKMDASKVLRGLMRLRCPSVTFSDAEYADWADDFECRGTVQISAEEKVYVLACFTASDLRSADLLCARADYEAQRILTSFPALKET